MTYNGWSNYETWNLKLWMDEEDTFWPDAAKKIWDDAKATEYNTREQAACNRLANAIENSVEMYFPPLKNGFYADIMSASIREINFYEIAESYIKEYSDQEVK